jgi:hypothetical protein
MDKCSYNPLKYFFVHFTLSILWVGSVYLLTKFIFFCFFYVQIEIQVYIF